jgi:tRNA (cmo5U34)-methyltransferase
MSTPLHNKSTTGEIRQRFDNDVERFSNLAIGQSATIDAPLVMELIANAATASTPNIRRVLDVGCGAGNNTIKLRQIADIDFDVDLLDLSSPMLDRAAERVSQCNKGTVRKIFSDFREASLETGVYDVILAAAVLHHLRDDADWRLAFEKIHRILAPGGSVWISDLVSHETKTIHNMMWMRYGDYIVSLKDKDYRDKVFQYIDKEDSPRPVTYQLDPLRSVGFANIELLHKSSCFAAFGATKGT